MYPTQKSFDRAVALQNYLILHARREALQEATSEVTISLATTTPLIPPSPVRSSSHASSASSSASEESCEYPVPLFASQPFTPSRRRSAHQEVAIQKCSPPVISNISISKRVRDKEIKLNNLNEEIKSALLNLLNCEGVRDNGRYREWVQTRLMETEKRLSDFRRLNCKTRNTTAAETMT